MSSLSLGVFGVTAVVFTLCVACVCMLVSILLTGMCIFILSWLVACLQAGAKELAHPFRFAARKKGKGGGE